MQRRSLARRLGAAFALTLTAVVGTSTGTATAAGPVLVINEIDYDQEGTDTAEFVEITNVGDEPADLSTTTLVFVNGANNTIYDTIQLSGNLAAGDYYVVCANAATVANCDLDDGPDTNFIQNGAPDAVALLVDGAIVDTVSYEGDVPGYTEGSGVGLVDDPDAGTLSISRCPDGVDTDQNNIDFVLTAITPGTTNDCESDPEPSAVLVINEIDYDNVGTDTAEYVEITNVGDATADLSTTTLVFVNGANNTIYDTIQLTGNLAAGDYYVVCANAATVANCDLDDGPDTNFIQNGSPDAVALLVDGTIVDTVSYEGDTPGYTEGTGGAPADSNTVQGGISRCPDGVDTDQNNLDFVFTAITPGTTNDCGTDPDPETVLISEVQGSGGVAAMAGLVVTVEAIVTADFQGDDQLRGFFLQEEDADADADPNTSEGIFVFCGACPTDVSVGDLVEVTGLANEFFGMSQINATFDTDIDWISGGNPLPTPVDIDLPAGGSTRAMDTFESTEGMLVTFTDTLVVGEYFELARYGHLVLNADTRARQFTDANEPSVAGYGTYLDELNASRIYLDDDNNRQNDPLGSTPAADTPYFWPRPGLSTTNYIRGGDSIDGLTGVLHWSFAGQSGTDAWRVRPVLEEYDYTFTSANPRSESPDDVGGTLKVASFNVLNYFTTLDSRGADSVAELDRQRAKIAAAICAMDADIVGLIEIENNGSVAIDDLLNGLDGVNENCGDYTYVDTGPDPIGTDAIAVAFIYRPDTVSAAGDYAILDSSVDPRFDDDRNRPALAQTFIETATGVDVTVVVNHLKSKGSACTEDPDIGDGQGNCNNIRTEAAAAMVDWLATNPTGAIDDNVLIIGDLNAYRNEDPIDAIEAGPDGIAGTDDDYTDLLDSLIGPSAYSYLFDGQLGYLDHALAGPGLVDQVTGATVWHINADEIPLFDYNDDIRDPGEASFERESSALPLYEPNAFRASDHDPVIVGLDLSGDQNAAPVCSAAVASIPTIQVPNHRLVLIEVFGVTDPDGDEVSITIDSIWQDEPVDGVGGGNTQPDAFGVGTSAALVRAERSGTGDGRAYHIGFTATDDAGASCSGTVIVMVPRGERSVDGGALFDSTTAP